MEPKHRAITHVSKTNECPEKDQAMTDNLNHERAELENRLRHFVKTEIRKALQENQTDGMASSKEQDTDRTVGDKLKRFMAMSTFHGVSHISSSNQLWMRVFWLVLLLGQLHEVTFFKVR